MLAIMCRVLALKSNDARLPFCIPGGAREVLARMLWTLDLCETLSGTGLGSNVAGVLNTVGTTSEFFGGSIAAAAVVAIAAIAA